MADSKPISTATTSAVFHINRSELKFVKPLGEGGSGSVFQMTWMSPELGPLEIAAKRLNQRDVHELEIMSGLKHPNIVRLLGVVDEEIDFMLILELCDRGSLRSYLKELHSKHGKGLPDQQFHKWAEQAAIPLKYLREQHIVHKDVKSPNYMITAENTLKLGDFGIAKNIAQTITNATETASWPWMAPELLKGGILSPKYDIFAYGVVVWEMRTRKLPFEGVEQHNIVWRVCHDNERLPIPEDCPEPIKDLMTRCWETDWKKRPDISEVLSIVRTTSAKSAASTASTATAIIVPPRIVPQEGVFSNNFNIPQDTTGQAATASATSSALATEKWTPLSREIDSTPQMRPSAWYQACQARIDEVRQNQLIVDGPSSIKRKADADAAYQKTRQKQILDGPWMLEEVFDLQDGPGKVDASQGIAVNPRNGDIAVASFWTPQVKVYTPVGKYKYSMGTDQGLEMGEKSNPRQVAVKDDTYFVTDTSKCVKWFHSHGISKGQWISCCPMTELTLKLPPVLHGLAIDHDGHVLVGDHNNKIINKHEQKGSYLSSIKVEIQPMYIAATQQGTVVVAHGYMPPQIVNSSTGAVMCSLKHPVKEGQWNPVGLTVHENTILVANMVTDNILCYDTSGKYLATLPISGILPRGIAMPGAPKMIRGMIPRGVSKPSAGRELLVCEFRSVKV